jgi:hypothetical protein
MGRAVYGAAFTTSQLRNVVASAVTTHCSVEEFLKIIFCPNIEGTILCSKVSM